MTSKAKKPSRLIYKPEVLERVGRSYPTIWNLMRAGKFPIAREIGGSSAWLESEIDEYIRTRPLRKYKGA